MKTLSLCLMTCFFTFLGHSQTSEQGHNITVTIDNISNNEGHVLLGLHNSDTFMNGRGLQSKKSIIENGKITVVFENVIPGEYAILALHDKNDNEMMDFENGMPSESYGMSNNNMSFGPPEFKDAKFEMKNEDITMNIRF